MKTYPVNLLLQNRKCLVVGGGKVATRKINNLLQAAADIIVVAPDVSSRIEELAVAGKILLEKRKYQEADLHDKFIVYAATDDHRLNRAITAAAEEKNILVCSVDQHWIGGSFITPATIRKDEITVAVSSNGLDCRKARMIKENLARHINAIEHIDLLVFGTDHNHLPLSQREDLHLTPSRLNQLGETLLNLWGMHEFALINTCNRVELIAAANVTPTMLNLLKILFHFDDLNPGQYYVKTGFDAFRHLCLESSGLLSQLSGENHIAAQMKRAIAHAEKHNWSGTLVSSMHSHIAHIAKHIRSMTASLLKNLDIEKLTAEYLGAECLNKNLTVVGTGQIGTGLKNILAEKVKQLDWLYYRNRPEANEKNVKIAQLKELPLLLPDTDILITALSVENPLITPAMVELCKPGVVIVDLGIPANVDAAVVVERPDLRIVTLEHLQQWRKHHGSKLKKAMNAAEHIIEEHRGLYEKFIESYLDGNPRQPVVNSSNSTVN